MIKKHLVNLTESGYNLQKIKKTRKPILSNSSHHQRSPLRTAADDDLN